MEIGYTKPKEVLADWDDTKIKAANLNSRALNALFSMVTNEEFKRYTLLKLQKKHGLSSRQPMKELRPSKIQSFKDLLRALKKLR